MHAQDVIRWGDHFLKASLEGIPDAEKRKTGVCGVWSVKDILAHLSASELMLSDVLGTFLGQTATPTMDDITAQGGTHHWNDWSVAQRAHLTMDEVLAEYQAALDHNLEIASAIPSDTYSQTGSLPWYGAAYDLDDFIVYTFYGHKREHGAEIRHFRSGLGGS